MAKLHTYLNFNGNCDEAFRHYQTVFKSERLSNVRFGDVPPNPDHPLSIADKDKIMHTSILINDDTLLMGTDILKAFGHKYTCGNNAHVMLVASSAKEANYLYKSLTKEAKSINIELAETFFAELYTSFKDRFGINWMILYTGNKERI